MGPQHFEFAGRLIDRRLAAGIAWLVTGLSWPVTCQAQLVQRADALRWSDLAIVAHSDAEVPGFTVQATSVAVDLQNQAPPPPAPPETAAPASAPVPPPIPKPEVVEPAKPKDPPPAQANIARPSYLPEQRPISQISIDVRTKPKSGSDLLPTSAVSLATGELPSVMAAPAEELMFGWNSVQLSRAEEFPYKPLYFEEVNLERYGRSCGVWQPAVSTTRFFATIPLLPYAMTIHPPRRELYWRWPYEAGWMAPRVRELPPFSAKAALVEAGVITGAVWLIP